MDFTIIDSKKHEEIKKCVLGSGRFKLYKSSFYKEYDPIDVQGFAVQNALYQIPTIELIEFLKQWVIPGKTIEVAAGHGFIGKCLRIPSTDLKIQNYNEIKLYYKLLKQPTIAYPERVKTLGALEAIKKYKPKVVIASWCTSKIDINGQELNAFGPDEEQIINNVDTYIMIGNDFTHGTKLIRKYPHRVYTAKWLVSRSARHDLNRIYIWTKSDYKEIDNEYFKVTYEDCCL